MKHNAPAYSSGKCRCEEICKPAWAAYMRSYRRRRREAGGMKLLDARWLKHPAGWPQQASEREE